MITTTFTDTVTAMLGELWLMPDSDQRKALAYVKARLAGEQAYRSYQAACLSIDKLERKLEQATDRKVRAGARMVAATDRAQQIKDRDALQALRDANPWGAYDKPCPCSICNPTPKAPAYDDDGLPL